MDQVVEQIKSLQMNVSDSGPPTRDTAAPVSESTSNPTEVTTCPTGSADGDAFAQILQRIAYKPSHDTPKDSLVCTVCKSPAKDCCKACSNVKILNTPGQAGFERTFYCSKECQTSDWPKHKGVCKVMKCLIDDKMLGRAAKFLQKAFYMLRKSVYDVSIDSIEVRGDTIVLKEGKYDTAKVLVDFPEDLIKGEKPFVRTMLYSLLACTDQFRSLHDLCNTFLKETGLAKRIEEVHFWHKPTPLRWEFHRAGGKIEEPEDYLHCAYRITMRSGSKYSLDLAGAQFGYTVCLQPWDNYQKERILIIDTIDAFGTNFHENSEVVKSVANKTIFRPTVDDMAKITRHVLAHLAEWFTGEAKLVFREAGWDIKKLLACCNQNLYEKVVHVALGTSVSILNVHKEKCMKRGGFVGLSPPVSA